MQIERGSHSLVALPDHGTLWAIGGGAPSRQLDSVEVLLCPNLLLQSPCSAPILLPI